MQLTGAFNHMHLLVVAATIVTTKDGRVRDVFQITDQQHRKVCTCALTDSAQVSGLLQPAGLPTRLCA